MNKKENEIKESGLKIAALINSSKLETEGLVDGFSAFFAINTAQLGDYEISLLKELVVGEVKEDVYRAYIADNNEHPIIFEDKKSAYGTLLKEGKSLVKKFQFSLFSKTRVMINPATTQTISFIKK